MFLLRKPQPSGIRETMQRQASQGFNYSAVGASAAQPPPGFAVDHARVPLGLGKEVFEAGKAALRRWEQFQLGWVEPCWPDTPIEEGAVIATLARAFGLWWVNTCRVVYVVDEPRRFGFAFGTQAGHAEAGEERFLIEWMDDETVWYDILAMSRPARLLTRLAYPLTRRLQARFRRDSAAVMQRAVLKK